MIHRRVFPFQKHPACHGVPMRPDTGVRRRTGGRPGKGDRKDVRARPMRSTAELIDALALEAGVPITEYAAELLEIGLRHREELALKFVAKEVLPEAG